MRQSGAMVVSPHKETFDMGQSVTKAELETGPYHRDVEQSAPAHNMGESFTITQCRGD